MPSNFMTAPLEEVIAWGREQKWDEAPPELKDQFDAIVMQRKTDMSVEKAVQRMRHQERGQKMDEKAERDWPELKNKESDMYKRVSEAMEKNPMAVENDPEFYANTASKIGLEMGLLPAGFTPQRGTADPMDTIGAGEGGDAGDGGSTAGEDYLKNTEKIGEAFADLIDLKDPEVRKRIAANAEGDQSNG